jgi:hypothetical protein
MSGIAIIEVDLPGLKDIGRPDSNFDKREIRSAMKFRFIIRCERIHYSLRKTETARNSRRLFCLFFAVPRGQLDLINSLFSLVTS